MPDTATLPEPFVVCVFSTAGMSDTNCTGSEGGISVGPSGLCVGGLGQRIVDNIDSEKHNGGPISSLMFGRQKELGFLYLLK